MKQVLFRFPRIVGRSYGYRSTTVQPNVNVADDASAAVPIPYRGDQVNEYSAPASRRIIDGDDSSPGRSYITRTEDQLNSGPAPNRINRNEHAKNAGIIAAGLGTPDGMSGWPYDGGALYIPHQRIPRTPITVTAFQRTIDTSVTIPTVGIGTPVG